MGSMNSEQADLCIQKLLRIEIRELRHRHEVEIALLHAWYTMRLHGPADDQPSIEEQTSLVATSSLFDQQWYVEHQPRAELGDLSAAEHYVREGAFMGLNPGPEFDTMAYYLANPHVAKAGWPALVHHLQHGPAVGEPAV